MADPVVDDRLAMLRSMSADDIAALIVRLPFVAVGLAGRGPLVASVPALGGAREPDRRVLAAAIAHPMSVTLALQGLPVAAVQLAIVLSTLGSMLSVDELDRELAPLQPDERSAIIDELVAHGLAERIGDLVTLRPGVSSHLGRPGRPLADLLLDQSMTSDDIAGILSRHRVHPVPSRKGQRIDLLRELVGDAATLRTLVESLPEHARALFERLADAGGRGLSCGSIGVNWWQVRARFALPAGTSPAVLALRQLSDLGLVWLDEPMQQTGLWLDVLRAWNGRLIPSWTPIARPSFVAAPTAEQIAAPAALSAFHTLLRHASMEPIPGLKSRGIGVKVIRDLAKRFGQSESATGLLLRLGVALRLIDEQSQFVGTGRNATWQYRYVTPELALAEWSATEPLTQWERLVSCWLDGRDEATNGQQVPHVRRLVVADLAALEPGIGVDRDRFADWCRDQHVLSSHAALDDLLAHLVVLDLVPATGAVALTTLARAFLDDPGAAAVLLPTPTTEFVVQADHTIVAPLTLVPVVRALLDRLCSVESTGSVTVYRLEADRIAQELAAGETAHRLLDLLADGSTVELPSTVVQLFHDAERRRGGLTVAAATTVVTADDVLGLAAAVKVKAARLTLIAPTVAISDLPRTKVMAALRAKGLAPAQADDPTPSRSMPTGPPATRRVVRAAADSPLQPGRDRIAAMAADLAGR
jgi:hypothetical protein